MIKLKDILNEGKQPLNEGPIFHGKAKVVLTSNAKDAQENKTKVCTYRIQT